MIVVLAISFYNHDLRPFNAIHLLTNSYFIACIGLITAFEQIKCVFKVKQDDLNEKITIISILCWAVKQYLAQNLIKNLSF